MTGRLWACTQLNARIPADSTEFLPILVTREGVEFKRDLTLSVAKLGKGRSWRPIDIDPTGRTGVNVRQLPAGTYRVAVRAPGGAVMEAGTIRTH